MGAPASLRTLTSGLRAVFVPAEAESVAVGVFVASGSRHEPPHLAGISHFLEHLLFKGTPTRRALDITRAIEGRGGNFNAMTGEESTCYYAHLPREYLAEAIDILADMYLNAAIPDDEFEREKAVVLEEIKMYADEPDSVAMENLQRSLFPASRLGASVAGSAKTLLPLKSADLRRYLAAHYRADNTVVVVAGAFDPAAAFALLERAFGRNRRRAGRRDRTVDRLVRPRAEIQVERDVNQVQLALGYRTFGLGDRRKYAATVLSAILGMGMSSRLFQEVREKRGLSYDIASRMQFFSEAGMFTVAAGLERSQARPALAVIDRELRRICERRVSAAELRRMREFLTGNFRLGHEKVTAKLFFYGANVLAHGRLVLPDEQLRGIAAVTPEDVQAVAQAIFRPDRRALSWVTPKGVKV